MKDTETICSHPFDPDLLCQGHGMHDADKRTRA